MYVTVQIEKLVQIRIFETVKTSCVNSGTLGFRDSDPFLGFNPGLETCNLGTEQDFGLIFLEIAHILLIFFKINKFSLAVPLHSVFLNIFNKIEK